MPKEELPEHCGCCRAHQRWASLAHAAEVLAEAVEAHLICYPADMSKPLTIASQMARALAALEEHLPRDPTSWIRASDRRYTSTAGWVLRAGGNRYPQVVLSLPLPCGKYWETVVSSHDLPSQAAAELDRLAGRGQEYLYPMIRDMIDTARNTSQLVRGVPKPDDDPRSYREFLADQLEELMEKIDAEHKHNDD